MKAMLVPIGATAGLADTRRQQCDFLADCFMTVLTFCEPSRCQTLTEARDHGRGHRKRRAAQKSNHRHRRLLRACRERPRGRAAEKRDELAAPHVGHGASLTMGDHQRRLTDPCGRLFVGECRGSLLSRK
jgi:hypothetical protein